MNFVVIFFGIILSSSFIQSSCSENCNAYSTYVDNPNYFGNYNLFYLANVNKSECKHCYFDINTRTSPGTYYFNIGIFDEMLGTFTSAGKGTFEIKTGINTCQYGYCAVWFSTSFSYFTLQAFPIQKRDNTCQYNTTFCTGEIPGYLSFSHISNSFFEYMDCEL
jgi:hypothetical protein